MNRLLNGFQVVMVIRVHNTTVGAFRSHLGQLLDRHASLADLCIDFREESRIQATHPILRKSLFQILNDPDILFLERVQIESRCVSNLLFCLFLFFIKLLFVLFLLGHLGKAIDWSLGQKTCRLKTKFNFPKSSCG